MKDKKLEEAVDYVCSCCPYIFSGSAEWDKSNPAFAGWRDSATKYCDRCMVRKMTDFYNALDEHEFSEGMPEYQAIEHYLGDAEEFYPDEHPQILEREVGYIFPLMEVEPTICIELKDEG